MSKVRAREGHRLDVLGLDAFHDPLGDRMFPGIDLHALGWLRVYRQRGATRAPGSGMNRAGTTTPSRPRLPAGVHGSCSRLSSCCAPPHC